MTVVCGVDDSSAARSVVAVAVALADALNATVGLVHVFDELPPVSPDDLTRGERERERAQGRARAVFSSVRSGLKPQTEVVEAFTIGPPAEALARFAEEPATAMLVVGSRGRDSVTSAALGSVSRALASQSAVPVVIVPPGASRLETDSDFGQTVLCGVDGSEQSLEAAKVAAALASRLAFELVVAHVMTGPPPGLVPASSGTGRLDQVALRTRRSQDAMDIAEQARAPVADIVPSHSRVATGDAASALDRAARETNGQLIVVGSRGRGRIKSLLGSVSARLGAQGSRPVVVVPAGAAERFLARIAESEARDRDRPE